MARLDLTVAVTAHNESVIAGPSMRSAEAAILAAEIDGFTVERRVGLDRPTDECRAFYGQSGLKRWTVTEFDFADPFLTRNALVQAASGRWIAFVDSDDLLSENWLVHACRRLAIAEAERDKVIVHPELNWIFEDSQVVFSKTPQDDPFFTPHYFYFSNYYDMMAAYPRSAALEYPYDSRDLKVGFGFQDWQWNIVTMDAGWRHVIVKNTVIFKRRRASSVSVQNRQRGSIIRALEPMAIDRVRDLHRRSGRAGRTSLPFDFCVTPGDSALSAKDR